MNTDTPENPEIPSADLLMELDWQSIKVSTFRAALELQVWNKVASEPKTAQRIAEENDWDLTGTQRLPEEYDRQAAPEHTAECGEEEHAQGVLGG